MSRTKKPRKAHRQVWNGDGKKVHQEQWRCAAVFGPMESILAGIEADGCVLSELDGTPVFQDALDGEWYQIAPSLEGLIEAYELHSKLHQRELPTRPLRVFASKLAHSMPLQESDLTDVRASLAALRAESMQMTVAYARKLISTYQARVNEETKKAAASRTASH